MIGTSSCFFLSLDRPSIKGKEQEPVLLCGCSPGKRFIKTETDLKDFFLNYEYYLFLFLSLVLMNRLPPGGQEQSAHLRTPAFASSRV